MWNPTLPAAPKSACSDTGQLHVGEAPTASNNSAVMAGIRWFASIVYQSLQRRRLKTFIGALQGNANSWPLGAFACER